MNSEKKKLLNKYIYDKNSFGNLQLQNVKEQTKLHMKCVRNFKSRILIITSKSYFSSLKFYITIIIWTVLNGDLRVEKGSTEVRAHACSWNFEFFVTHQKITKAGMSLT